MAAESDRRSSTRRSVLVGASAALVGAGAATVAFAWPSRPAAATSTVHGLLTTAPYSVAHRGGSLDWPEMSEYAYEQSVAHGVQALEMSLARTRDGVWFGLHDATLDRTSGTVGAVAAELSWQQVRGYRIAARGTRFPSQPSRPYYRLEDFLARFVPEHVVFLDPKAVDPAHYADLLALVHRRVPRATEHVVAKSDATDLQWAAAARRAGFHTWGFYYGSALAAQPGLLAATAHAWDLLGLDWQASADTWRAVLAVGKKVIGHVIETDGQRDEVLHRGATGLMIGDPIRVRA